MPIGSSATYTGPSASDPVTANLVATSFGSTQIPAWINAEQYSHPVYVASASDPLYNVHYIGERGRRDPFHGAVGDAGDGAGCAGVVGDAG
jgi:hypothetical protein